MKEYREAICKGSWQLGNNCKTCEKCLDTKNIDAEAELMKLVEQKTWEPKEVVYGEVKSKVDDFMKITNSNLDALYKFLTSAYQDIRFGNTQAGEYIKDIYGDDFYFRREQLKNEERERCSKKQNN